MLSHNESVHLRSTAQWNDDWQLHCGGICRRQALPPPVPDGYIVYEFYSQIDAVTQSKAPVVVWVAVPEEARVPFSCLKHLESDVESGYVTAWPCLRKLSDRMLISVVELDARTQLVKWQTQ